MSEVRFPFSDDLAQRLGDPTILGPLISRAAEAGNPCMPERFLDSDTSLVDELLVLAPPRIPTPWKGEHRQRQARPGPPVEPKTEELRWVVASDEAGFELKKWVRRLLAGLGADVSDLGPMVSVPVDYPDYAAAVGRALQAEDAHRGILLCGNGVGASVAANKMRGVRAGLCHDIDSVLQAVEHDDMNVLVLAARLVEERGIEEIEDLVQAFLSARFSGGARHRRCLEKVRTLEEMAARAS